MAAVIEIQVKADVAKAQTGLSDLVKKIGNFGDLAGNSSSKISNAVSAMTKELASIGDKTGATAFKIESGFKQIEDATKGIASIDFSKQFSQSTEKISFALQGAVNKALGFDNAIASIGQSANLNPLITAFTQAEKPVQQLEAELLALKGVIVETTNPAILQRFGQQLAALLSDLSKVRIQGAVKVEKIDIPRIDVPLIAPKIDVNELKSLQGAFTNAIQPVDALEAKIRALQAAINTSTDTKAVKQFKAEIQSLQSVLSGDFKGLKLNPGDLKLFQSAFVDSVKPLQQLESELITLQTAVTQATDPKSVILFNSQIEKLQAQFNSLSGASLQTAFVEAIKPAQQLENEVIALGKAIQTSTNPEEIIRFGNQIEKLVSQLNKTRIGGIDLDINTAPLTRLQSAFVDCIKPVNQLEDEIAGLQEVIHTSTNPKDIKILQDQVVKLQGQLNNVKISGFEGSIGKIGTASVVAANKLKQLPQVSNSATNALMNLGRVAQDAPFGFLGIANNLNPLLESFQRLRAESGSTKTALQSIVGSLTGAGGIGLALSVVSSLLIVFGDKMFGAGKSTEEAGKKFEFFTDRVNDIKDALEDVNTQIEFLSKLGSINIDINGQKRSLDLEGQVVDIVQKIAGAQKAYEDFGNTILDIQSKINSSDKKGNLIFTGKDREDLESKLKQAQDAQRKANEDQIKLEQDRVVAEANVRLQKKKESEEEAKDREEAHKKAMAALKKRNKEIIDAEKKAAEERRKIFESLRTTSISFETPTDFFKNLNREESQKSNPDFEKFVKNQFEGIKIKPVTPIVPINFKLITDKDRLGIDALALADEVNKAIESAAQNISVDAFAGIGDTIGSIISGNGLGDAFKALGAQIGAGIEALGKKLIELGAVALLAKSAIKSALTNPVALIGAGIALTALGAAFKNLTIPGFAAGGLVFGPTMGLIGEGSGTSRSNPEVIAPLDKLKNFIGSSNAAPNERLVAQVSGQNIDLVLQRFHGKQRRNG
jgi:hypothetical protein